MRGINRERAKGRLVVVGKLGLGLNFFSEQPLENSNDLKHGSNPFQSVVFLFYYTTELLFVNRFMVLNYSKLIWTSDLFYIGIIKAAWVISPRGESNLHINLTQGLMGTV